MSMTRKGIASGFVLIFFVSLWIGNHLARAEVPAEAGVLSGKDYAFTLKPPEGWILDTHASVAMDVNSVYYPEGATWDTAPAFMYATTCRRDQYPDHSLNSLLAGELKDFQINSPAIQTSPMKKLLTGDKKQVFARKFTGDHWNNTEAVAYIEEEKVFVVLTLSSRSVKEFEKALPAFESLVHSYVTKKN